MAPSEKAWALPRNSLQPVFIQLLLYIWSKLVKGIGLYVAANWVLKEQTPNCSVSNCALHNQLLRMPTWGLVRDKRELEGSAR